MVPLVTNISKMGKVSNKKMKDVAFLKHKGNVFSGQKNKRNSCEEGR